jgi:hypothetical protein
MSVAFVEGVWRVIDPDRATTIHGRDPQREAERIVAGLLDGREADLLVVIGLGLGFLLDALERRSWNGRVLAIEPEPETVAAMRTRRELAAWTAGDRLRILTGPAFEGATECWQWFGDGSTEPPLYVHPVFERIRPAEVVAARGVLQRIRFDAASNAEARRRHGARYLLNTLRNLPAIASQPDVTRLTDSASGKPAVIVAAGPSLDSSLAALREIQDRVLIVAVDTALRPLLAGGVRPHAVVAVDPSEANGRHLTELPACEDTFLVSEGSIDPFAVSTFRGRTYFFAVSDHQPWPWLRGMDAGVGRLRAWGSVLTSAFELVLAIDADPVIFVGADLSYPGERPYCRGVSFEEDWQRRERFGEPLEQQWRAAVDQWPLILEPDVSGVPVRTAPHLVAFRNWLVEQTQQRSRRFINAGGAGILRGPRIQQLTPAALVELCEREQWSAAGHPFRERYRPRNDARVGREATALAEKAGAGDTSVEVFREWQEFAPLLSIEAIAHALAAASAGFARSVHGNDAPATAATPKLGTVETDVQALQEVAAAVPLVAMAMRPERLDANYSGARVFRFRTTAAAIMSCAMRPLQSAVAEDGVSLTRVYDLDLVVPGTYAVVRDQVHFRAFDGSDPRTNGRRYTILVPPPVAYLEELPLQEIFSRRI